MRVGMLSQLMLLLAFTQCIGASVYSCEEMKYRTINKSFWQSTTFICVVTQEGFTNWNQLKQIKLDKYAKSLYDVAAADQMCFQRAPTPTSPWKFTADASLNLDCKQEFTVILSNENPLLITPVDDVLSYELKGGSRRVLAVPQTDMWIHTKSCKGNGHVTLYTGAGTSTNENRYELRSWPCSSVPDWIFSFDSVITIETGDPVTYSFECTNDLGIKTDPVLVRPGDRIAVLSSGQSNDLQDLRGGKNTLQPHRAYLSTVPNPKLDVFVDMDLTFDPNNNGSVIIQKAFGGPEYNFYNGTHDEDFNADYFEIRYVPQPKQAADIWYTKDNILIDVLIGRLPSTTTSSTTTTTVKPTTTTTKAATTTTTKAAPKTTTTVRPTTTVKTKTNAAKTTTARPTTTTVKTTTKAATTTTKAAATTTTTKTTTTAPKTTTTPRPPPLPTTTKAQPQTTTTKPLAVPASGQSPYCSCGFDKKFNTIGWNYNDIWVDIVVILDTSEAMGKLALEDAGTLVESFISDGFDDFLITNTSAPFYTRVGVISMADTATVLYNLNMTKTDRVTDKAAIKKGVLEIDVVAAFEAAQNMFNDGLRSKPDRVNARQVIYYMTDSDPKNNLNSLNQFKASKGVIIVNNFLQEGEVELPALKDLASEGYYFTNQNYMSSLQSFCKANCFCKPELNAYGGSDPAIKASGGCYHPAPSGVPFNKAKTTCSNGNGVLAAIHDDLKGNFLRDLLKTSKSDYFWFGYERSTEGVWQWEDQSTDSYTNWDVDEPSTASVAKCAYVDTSDPALPWGAGNCQLGFPYVCQYTPCSVGYKDC